MSSVSKNFNEVVNGENEGLFRNIFDDLPADELNYMSNLIYENKKLKWTGDLHILKEATSNIFGLDGSWISPGGTSKKFTAKNVDLSITWYPSSQNVLTFRGQAGEILKEVCEAFCKTNRSSSLQTNIEEKRPCNCGCVEMAERLERFTLDIEILKSRVDSMQAFVDSSGDASLAVSTQTNELQIRLESLEIELEETKIKNNLLQGELLLLKQRLTVGDPKGNHTETVGPTSKLKSKRPGSVDIKTQEIQIYEQNHLCITPKTRDYDNFCINSKRGNHFKNKDLSADNTISVADDSFCSEIHLPIDKDQYIKSMTKTNTTAIVDKQKTPLLAHSKDASSAPRKQDEITNMQPTNININNKRNPKQTPKNDIPCPFLSRRGWCLKKQNCDFKHPLYSRQIQPSQRTPKHRTYCPFLRRRGFCLKGDHCDFLHCDTSNMSLTHWSKMNYSNPFLFHPIMTVTPNLLQSPSNRKKMQITSNHPMISRPMYPWLKPLMDIPTYPPRLR